MRAAGPAAALIAAAVLAGCDTGWNGEPRDFRQDMRDFVVALSAYAREGEPGFVVIPQNGHELLTADGDAGGEPATAYVGAISGVGREDLLYGYEGDGVPTPAAERDAMLAFMDRAEDLGVEVLATDYTGEGGIPFAQVGVGWPRGAGQASGRRRRLSENAGGVRRVVFHRGGLCALP